VTGDGTPGGVGQGGIAAGGVSCKITQLYEQWTTIQGFQRTRGVLKLMAKVIHRLWQDNDKDIMILPGITLWGKDEA